MSPEETLSRFHNYIAITNQHLTVQDFGIILKEVFAVTKVNVAMEAFKFLCSVSRRGVERNSHFMYQI